MPFKTRRGKDSSLTFVCSQPSLRRAEGDQEPSFSVHHIPHKNWLDLRRKFEGVAAVDGKWSKASFSNLTRKFDAQFGISRDDDDDGNGGGSSSEAKASKVLAGWFYVGALEPPSLGAAVAKQLKVHIASHLECDAAANGLENLFHPRMLKSIAAINQYLSSLPISSADASSFLSPHVAVRNKELENSLNNGQYFAVDSTVDILLDALFLQLGDLPPSSALTILEPSCGTGHLVMGGRPSLLHRLKVAKSAKLWTTRLVLCDVDRAVLRSCAGRIEEHEASEAIDEVVECPGDFTIFSRTLKQDGNCLIVLAGVPYGSFDDRQLPNRFLEKFKLLNADFVLVILPKRMEAAEMPGYNYKKLGDVREFVNLGGRKVLQPSVVLQFELVGGGGKKT